MPDAQLYYVRTLESSSVQLLVVLTSERAERAPPPPPPVELSFHPQSAYLPSVESTQPQRTQLTVVLFLRRVSTKGSSKSVRAWAISSQAQKPGKVKWGQRPAPLTEPSPGEMRTCSSSRVLLAILPTSAGISKGHLPPASLAPFERPQTGHSTNRVHALKTERQADRWPPVKSLRKHWGHGGAGSRPALALAVPNG